MDVRKIFRWIHRELGYFFAVMAIIYGISGIALNHSSDWNPDMVITRTVDSLPKALLPDSIGRNESEAILSHFNESGSYKKHYFPNDSTLKIFFHISGGSGNVMVDIKSRQVVIERLERRFFFYQINRLHRNAFRSLWTWFSDIFALSLVIFAITGIFMMKGKYGLAKHGIYWLLAGAIIPILLYLHYSI
ncbi:MAG TPA: PepSY-associated TM helix domain-containing protein [Salinivirgaceae bacterium]|nr:PepSY-associated TM helix domain-containing protein [Salinivirgaceae bacterium]